MLPPFARRALAPIALAVCLLGSSLAAQGTPSLTLFNGEGLDGAAVTVRSDVANLQDMPAREGFDGTANDYAFSLKAEGLWLVCMDAGFRTRCREVSGEVQTLGEDGGSISSVRYLGPSAQTPGSGRPAGTPGQSVMRPPADAPPMFNTDLFGSDLREIIYDRPGMDWKSCKAACDDERQCRAWTYVIPGRTEHGECFLKEAVPEPSESDCCVSGIKRQRDGIGSLWLPQAAPVPDRPRPRRRG
ncbi:MULTISPECIES: PAN domain-containing protein [Pseudomonadota]|nr:MULTISPECIES: PAN domain-containing protein [Pseudomonadota]